MKCNLQLAATAAAAFALQLLSACQPKPVAPVPTPAVPAAPAHADAALIDWFKGDVDAAFAAARREHKPVLLYWGAVWCPPCQQLKATVFERADFVAKTRQFIPVYLDGDAAGAQKWGEQFKVTGYPTMLVLSPERAETLRIAGGMDLSQYANLLDLSLADLQPTDEVLKAGESRALNRNECARLALNAWLLDDADAQLDASLGARLQRAAARCPAEALSERQRLTLLAALYTSNGQAPALHAGKAPSAALAQQVKDITAMLEKAQLLAGNSDALSYLGESFFLAVKAQGADQARKFNEQYGRAMERYADNPQFAAADHLAAVGSRLDAEKALTGAISPAVKQYGREHLDAALAGDDIPYVRSGIINAALPIFEMLGANAEAYRLLQAELGKTQTPYYYQADLADLAEALGRKDEAVSWAAKAYEGSRGAATRFQWGNLYLTALLRLRPRDTARIQSTGLAVLGELEGSDRIYRRARLRLEKLDGLLIKWQGVDRAARRPVLVALRARMNQTCATIPAAEPARRSCDRFLSTGL
jgi:thioredoxin-like negative regulator of GroEL